MAATIRPRWRSGVHARGIAQDHCNIPTDVSESKKGAVNKIQWGAVIGFALLVISAAVVVAMSVIIYGKLR